MYAPRNTAWSFEKSIWKTVSKCRLFSRYWNRTPLVWALATKERDRGRSWSRAETEDIDVGRTASCSGPGDSGVSGGFPANKQERRKKRFRRDGPGPTAAGCLPELTRRTNAPRHQFQFSIPRAARPSLGHRKKTKKKCRRFGHFWSSVRLEKK